MKLNIDTDAVRTAHKEELDDQASLFWGDLEDSLDGLSRTEQIQLFAHLRAIVTDRNAFTAFVNGTFAQDSTGSPAKALGAGTSTGSSGGNIVDVRITQDEKNLLDSIRNASSGQQLAIMRILHDGSSGKSIGDKIDVERDGTPSQVKNLINQVAQLTTQRDNALDDHLKEKDPKHAGSLAEQLEKAKTSTTPAIPADMVAKADIKPIIEDIKSKSNGLSSSAASNKVKGKDELVAKVDEALGKVS